MQKRGFAIVVGIAASSALLSACSGPSVAAQARQATQRVERSLGKIPQTLTKLVPYEAELSQEYARALVLEEARPTTLKGAEGDDEVAALEGLRICTTAESFKLATGSWPKGGPLRSRCRRMMR